MNTNDTLTDEEVERLGELRMKLHTVRRWREGTRAAVVDAEKRLRFLQESIQTDAREEAEALEALRAFHLSR